MQCRRLATPGARRTPDGRSVRFGSVDRSDGSDEPGCFAVIETLTGDQTLATPPFSTLSSRGSPPGLFRISKYLLDSYVTGK